MIDREKIIFGCILLAGLAVGYIIGWPDGAWFHGPWFHGPWYNSN